MTPDSLQREPCVRRVRSDEVMQALTTALRDTDCRAILAFTADGFYPVSKIAAECGISETTTYRKLGLLTDAGLIEKRSEGRGATYTQRGEILSIRVTGDGLEATVLFDTDRDRRP